MYSELVILPQDHVFSCTCGVTPCDGIGVLSVCTISPSSTSLSLSLLLSLLLSLSLLSPLLSLSLLSPLLSLLLSPLLSLLLLSLLSLLMLLQVQLSQSSVVSPEFSGTANMRVSQLIISATSFHDSGKIDTGIDAPSRLHKTCSSNNSKGMLCLSCVPRPSLNSKTIKSSHTGSGSGKQNQRCPCCLIRCIFQYQLKMTKSKQRRRQLSVALVRKALSHIRSTWKSCTPQAPMDIFSPMGDHVPNPALKDKSIADFCFMYVLGGHKR